MNFLMLDEKRAVVEAEEEPIHRMLEGLGIKSIKVRTSTSTWVSDIDNMLFQTFKLDDLSFLFIYMHCFFKSPVLSGLHSESMYAAMYVIAQVQLVHVLYNRDIYKSCM